jgi:hypothetical protein
VLFSMVTDEIIRNVTEEEEKLLPGTVVYAVT